MNRSVYFRLKFLSLGYGVIIRPIMFLMAPEKIHGVMIKIGQSLGANGLRKIFIFWFNYQNPILEQTISGIKFQNPVGLSGGFDKNAQVIGMLSPLGFGFGEVGSITAKAYGGNTGHRLYRLKKSKSLVVNYGLANEGVDAIVPRLKNRFEIPIGTNIAMTNSPKMCDTKVAITDYVYSFKKLARLGDYFTVNISCPNTVNGQPFHYADKLDRLLSELDKIPTKKPVFLKISPDLNDSKLKKIVKTARQHRVLGFICSNLTDKRNNSAIFDKNVPEHGGISGKVLQKPADDLLRKVYKLSDGKMVLIGTGGIFCAADAYRKIKLGASLVQLITGCIYQGPQLVATINAGLVDLLEADGYTNISQAVGAGNKINTNRQSS